MDQQFSGQSTSYTLAEAQAIMEELRNIQKSLSCGEKEKVELMQVCMKWCIIIIIFTILSKSCIHILFNLRVYQD